MRTYEVFAENIRGHGTWFAGALDSSGSVGFIVTCTKGVNHAYPYVQYADNHPEQLGQLTTRFGGNIYPRRGSTSSTWRTVGTLATEIALAADKDAVLRKDFCDTVSEWEKAEREERVEIAREFPSGRVTDFPPQENYRRSVGNARYVAGAIDFDGRVDQQGRLIVESRNHPLLQALAEKYGAGCVYPIQEVGEVFAVSGHQGIVSTPTHGWLLDTRESKVVISDVLDHLILIQNQAQGVFSRRAIDFSASDEQITALADTLDQRGQMGFRQHPSRSGVYEYPVIGLSGTSQEVEALQRTFGGLVSHIEGRRTSRWQIRGRKAAALAEILASYLSTRSYAIEAFRQWQEALPGEPRARIVQAFREGNF